MGEVTCSTHGPSRGKLVCRDISAALRERTPLPARADTSLASEIGQTLELTLCAACLVEHGIPLEAAPIADEEVDSVDAILALQDLVCRKCFAAAERELGTSSR
jgi:hypothetical protein